MANTSIDATPGTRWTRLAKLTLGGLLYDALLAIPGGWALMLAVGLAHHQWWPAIPTIGYLTAAVFLFLAKQVVRALTAQSTYLQRDQAAIEQASP